MMRLESGSTLEGPIRDTVHGWLREYNIEKNSGFMAAIERGAANPLIVTACNDDGTVIGGLFGDTLFDWLRIHVMAVTPNSRRTGIGAQLLAHAENEAKTRGCTRAYVDTMSFQSPSFYLRQGYLEVGRIPNWDSHGHSKHFLTKQL